MRVVSDKIDDVSRDPENKITTLNNTIQSVNECMDEMINAQWPRLGKKQVGRDRK